MRCLFFVCCFLSSFAFSQDTLWSHTGQPSEKYILFEDGRFEYRWWACISGSFGHGSYELKKRKAVFNFEEVDTISHSIEESRIEGDSIEVNILRYMDRSNYPAKVITSNGAVYASWEQKGMTFPKCDSAKLRIMGYPTIALDFTKTENNAFDILLHYPENYGKISPKKEVFRINKKNEFTQKYVSKWKDENGKRKRKRTKLVLSYN